MLCFLKKSFITGLILTLPLGVTIFVTHILLHYVGEPSSKILFYWLDIGMRNTTVFKIGIDIVSILLVVIIIVLIGAFSKLVFGKLLIGWTEKLINKVPFVSTVYKTVKQVMETLGQSQKAAFSKAVLIEYPKENCYAIGFIASETESEARYKTGKEVVNVFVPTTPNPTSGFLLMVPKKDVISLDMSVPDGMKLIISGGIVVPPYKIKKQQKEM